ncbi:MAG: DUF1491 family protein [Beijerinckiaceae bacterium]
MSRLRSDFWVSAYLRRCGSEGLFAVLRRRGAPEAGAIFIIIDRLDGSAALFGPAPQGSGPAGERAFARFHKEDWIDPKSAEARLVREITYDPDLWIIEVEDRLGRTFLDPP